MIRELIFYFLLGASIGFILPQFFPEYWYLALAIPGFYIGYTYNKDLI